LKIDKHIKDLYRRVQGLSANGNGNYGDDDDDGSYGLYKHDDEYYLDRGLTPPRIINYRHVRWEKLDEQRKEKIRNGYDVDTTITQDELYFILKRKLRPSPEQRYQHEKSNFLFHDLSCYMNGLLENGHGCTGGGCIPECRFYPEYGRIEDKEAIEKHNKWVESLRQENSIVEPASESELLRLAEKYHFH